MTLKKILYIACTAILFAGASSCKKDTFNINRNPNDPTDSTVTYDVILPAALHSTGAVVGTSFGFLQNWLGFWARSGTYAPNVLEESYQITTTFGNAIWNGLYDNLYDYQVMQIKAEQADADFYAGIARIMKAHNFQMLVDVYNNIPYRDALKGNANPTPKYDKGADIYKDLLRQLDTAILLINGADQTLNVGIRDQDIMFGSTVTASYDAQKLLWMKFANTLKLRLLVHLMNGGVNTPTMVVPGFNIPAEIVKIQDTIPGGITVGFLSSGQNAQVNPGYKSDKPNPFYNLYKLSTTGAQTANNVYYRANSYAIGYYNVDQDPRIARLYSPAGGAFRGVAYGLPPVNENAASTLSAIGPGLAPSNTSPQPIMTAAESFWLQAEARVRGFITSGPSAQQLLETGIYENFFQLGVPNPSAATASYLAYNGGFPDVDMTATSATSGVAGGPSGGVFTIISQKWFGLNGLNTLEVWTDYRRVNMIDVNGRDLNHFVYGEGAGFVPGPPISVSPQNKATEIPVRLLYPQTEYNYNAANVGAEGTINQFTSRIFWDLK